MELPFAQSQSLRISAWTLGPRKVIMTTSLRAACLTKHPRFLAGRRSALTRDLAYTISPQWAANSHRSSHAQVEKHQKQDPDIRHTGHPHPLHGSGAAVVLALPGSDQRQREARVAHAGERQQRRTDDVAQG